MKKKLISAVAGYMLVTTAAQSVEFEASFGAHDFVVSNIQDDCSKDMIDSGTSHTFGLNSAIWVKHTTQNNIHLTAKAEVFYDYDKDELDPDHIPFWFDFLVDVDGPMYSINESNNLQWYILMENRQNTVSSIERTVKQHVGVGYRYDNQTFFMELNGYLGFYYIEFDDDVPVSRGYNRQQTDDGEASTVAEIQTGINFTQDVSFSLYAKRYLSNTGFERLEDNFGGLLSWKNIDFLAQGATLNLKVKYVQYDLDRFYDETVGIPIVPFDNDMLVQTYVTIPF
jgi:hypothetical protein